MQFLWCLRRFTFNVSLNTTGEAHYVVLPANNSLPTVVDSQSLFVQAAASLFAGFNVAASGDMRIPNANTNYSQVVLVCRQDNDFPPNLTSVLLYCLNSETCSCYLVLSSAEFVSLHPLVQMHC